MTVNVDPDRAARAATALQAGTVEVKREGPREWAVSSFNGGESYRVALRPPSCTCPDATYRGKTCKHLIATVLTVGLT